MLEGAPPGMTPEQWMRALACELVLGPDLTPRQIDMQLRTSVRHVYHYIKNGTVPVER